MILTATLVLALAAATYAAPAPPPFPGYIVATQFRCDDFLCPDWELDVTRVDLSFRPKNLTLQLASLLPKAPVQDMSFPVFASFHAASRVYNVLANQVPFKLACLISFQQLLPHMNRIYTYLHFSHLLRTYSLIH